MPGILTTRFAMLTDVGRVRAHNEDACGADPDAGAYVVCDGMGGAAGGEIASRESAAAFLARARQPLANADPAEVLADAVGRANRAVYQRSQREPRLRGMGTTLVALQTVSADGAVWVTHVGDSRCYRLRDGGLERLTDDHSLVEEQVRSGKITADEARRSHLRNVITRVVGTQAAVQPDVVAHPCRSGDLFLLCSDGLNRDLLDDDLADLLRQHRGDLHHAARVLVDAANLLGGGDNITVLLLEIVSAAGEASEASRVARMSELLEAAESVPGTGD